VLFCSVNNRIRKLFLGLMAFISFLFQINELQATHLRAGEIIATKRSTFEYDFTLVLYRNTNGVEQPNAELDFGDGTSQKVDLFKQDSLDQKTQRLIFNFRKNFPGAATYTVSFREINRNNGILNINSGFSDNTAFYVESQVTIDPLLGANTSPQFLYPPLDNGNINQTYTHGPAAWDAEGDSLSYELITPQSQKGTTVPNYVLPNQIGNNGSNPTFTMNSQTGLITWEKPLRQGLYNIAFKVNEWRNGYLIGYVVRDMQINILFSTNIVPILNIPKDTCLTAGLLLKDTITATFQENETKSLQAYSGIFSFPKPKDIFNAKTKLFKQTNTAESMSFEWQTGCELIRAQPYQVTFEAQDNIGEAISLSAIKVWQIKIIPPALTILKATPSGRKITLNWDAYFCSNVDSIAILRKECENDTPLVTDSCDTGRDIPKGYNLLKKVRKTATSFTDDNFGKGLNYETQYCYYVYAQFPSPEKGYSRASALACGSLTNDVPILIGASVLKTDSVSGEVEIKWIKPRHIDFTQNSAPYEIKIRRTSGITTTEILNRTTLDTLALSDTTFIDVTDTKANNLSFFIEFYANNKLIYISETASTVRLQGVARAGRAILKWAFATPWVNDTTIIYRITDNDTLAIDTVNNTNGYVNQPLETGKLFRYFAKTKGGLGCNRIIGIGKVPYPLYNLSQTISLIPLDEKNDTLRPCPPTLYINSNRNCEDQFNFSNSLYWNKNLDFLCDSAIVGYKLYKNSASSTFDLFINEVITDTTYEGRVNKPVSGCFAVTATNAKGLESDKSNVVCSDSCFYFELPNTFTPNNDNINDVFVPKPFPRNIEKVVFTVYNRWGTEIFKTENDININWKAENIPDGLYYFKAEITIGVPDTRKINRNGWILLAR